MTEATLLLIKPDAVRRRLIGEILRRLEATGFVITGLQLRRLTTEQAARFYAVHEGRSFLPGLVEFMCSGPLVAVRLEAGNARARVRELVGDTDPTKARAGSIRALFGTSVRENAVHAANPEEDVERELEFFFPDTG